MSKISRMHRTGRTLREAWGHRGPPDAASAVGWQCGSCMKAGARCCCQEPWHGAGTKLLSLQQQQGPRHLPRLPAPPQCAAALPCSPGSRLQPVRILGGVLACFRTGPKQCGWQFFTPKCTVGPAPFLQCSCLFARRVLRASSRDLVAINRRLAL
jgi:hypothetical protein